MPSGTLETGAAWLSSARVVKCWVKSRNERNPYPLLPARNGGNSKETAGDKPEEGGDDVKVIMALTVGATHTCYNGRYKEKRPRESKRNSLKSVVVRIESATLDSMKSESLVIVDQNATVNTFPGLVHTARHTMGVGCKRSR